MINDAIKAGDIVIDPFDPIALGSNSYDVRLGDTLLVYRPRPGAIICAWLSVITVVLTATVALVLIKPDLLTALNTGLIALSVAYWSYHRDMTVVLDSKHENATRKYKIGPEGFVLRPGVIYLAATYEYTETHKYVPYLDGRSSVGRLGTTIHCTAGRGDVGFKNHWTMEIHVIQPVRIYAGIRIGQLTYHMTGDVAVPYDQKPTASYVTQRNAEPQPSRLWKSSEPPP